MAEQRSRTEVTKRRRHLFLSHAFQASDKRASWRVLVGPVRWLLRLASSETWASFQRVLLDGEVRRRTMDHEQSCRLEKMSAAETINSQHSIIP